MRIALTLVVIAFVLFCGWLVVATGLFDESLQNGRGCILLQQTTATEMTEAVNVPAPKNEQLQADETVRLGADDAPSASVALGSVDPKSGFKYRLELSSKGAAIKEAVFSEFDDRDHKDPQPLVILSPANGDTLSMANKEFVVSFKGQEYAPLPMDRLHWESLGVERGSDGSQTARFKALISVEDTGEPVFRLTKTYSVVPDSYLLDFDITVENLSAAELKTHFNLAGPVGLGREDSRTDMRKIVAGFRDSKQQIVSTRLDKKTLAKAKSLEDKRPENPGGRFLWIATVNKYFAAIVVPLTDGGKDWVADKTGRFYNPDGDAKSDSGDEALGLDLGIASNTLAATGQTGSSRTYNFQMYLGPKDKSLFDKNEQYNSLGFYHTIDFMGCCCPAWIIKPLAFGILAIMKWMYGFIHNYGVVIIILVFLMRLCMHPVTKKSQVSMSKMSQLAPKAEEIKKKYANNKAEMNKQMMALYREQGASPIMGFLPMMVQMPIWIALWSAVYASIDLRGAGFLPFWITDLSVPDALYRFPSVIVVPLLGTKIESLNLLPLMMGVAFYLQQRLMPTQANASTNPQMAQQQKMMKIMMPLLFPLMLYKAPSGVNLYIMASTFAGVFEQHVIRKHIREKEQAESEGMVAATSKTGGKVKKKKPKPFYKT
ncbi:MAG: membrane protein insertase YidC [Planctomycetota bacterium]|jgi:YidC/Oxa1 family membrane protein insertase